MNESRPRAGHDHERWCCSAKSADYLESCRPLETRLREIPILAAVENS